MRVVAVSPHLDDAVFSAGATLAALAATGARVEVVTVFTATVPSPRGFALACQTDKGIPSQVDYMALRRREDVRACEAIGALAVHLGLPEAPHRGYGSAADLFAGAREDDRVWQDVAAVLVPLLRDADLVLTCQGVGAHVDHLQVLRALGERPDARWRDLPYGLRTDAGPPPPSHVAESPEPAALAAKLAGCSAYGSQLGFQFGGERPMRRRLRAAPERWDRSPLALVRSSSPVR